MSSATAGASSSAQPTAATPDDWVDRSKHLLPLTGIHPFNGEVATSSLLDQGFYTPVTHHFVRNHGRVARVSAENYSLNVLGAVPTPTSFTLPELQAMPRTALPITLSCSANRRGELNMQEKTLGFHWTSSAISNNMYAGVSLAHVLEQCGVKRRRGYYIIMQSYEEEELPQSPSGCYGTSIELNVALDPENFVLLAFEQDGKPLASDHGAPVRVMVPGFVGGRSVKWVKNIIVSSVESSNFYHYMDNRIVPSHIRMPVARDEGWIKRKEYLYNELNINSVMTHPSHGTVLSQDDKDTIFKGYAFSGAGRKITRVEISLDDGGTWVLCDLDYPEEKHSTAPDLGKYYCWMFWSISVPTTDVFKASKDGHSFRCRAWDTSNNTQPEQFSWNFMGMGNNCQYIVLLSSEDSETKLRVVHPVSQLGQKTGWMETGDDIRPNRSSGPALASVSVKQAESAEEKEESNVPDVFFTKAEVKKHSTRESAWIIVNNLVYDTTKYLDDHPGGAESILLVAGEDCTFEFTSIHTPYATDLLQDYCIGKLQAEENAQEQVVPESEDSLCALSPKEWTSLKLVEKKSISPDTLLLEFSLPAGAYSLMLPCGKHITCRTKIGEEFVQRAYTPVSNRKKKGGFTLCVKIYKPNVHPQFPDGGKLTPVFDSMNVGDAMEFIGPLGRIWYKSAGVFQIVARTVPVSAVGLICGGTGIAPAYQVLLEMNLNEADKTAAHLLFANNTEADILLRAELDEVAQAKENVSITHTLLQPPANWEGESGYVTEEMIRKYFPSPDQLPLVGLCGPPPMIEAVEKSLKSIGFAADQIVKF